MNKNDLRYIKTEENIRNAFYECVNQVGFEKTRISDICSYAKISRNTFYDHYIDKYDLLDRLFETLQEQFRSNFNEKLRESIRRGEVKDSVIWYVDIVWKNREFYDLLLKCSPDQFQEILKEAVMHGPRRSMLPDYDQVADDIYAKLLLEYLFQGMVGFTRVWLGCQKELPKEQVIEELQAISEPLVRLHSNKLEELSRKNKKKR